MAFFKCGGNKNVTTIDGVESEKDLKLESLGIIKLGNVSRIPEGVAPNYTYKYDTFNYNYMVPYKDSLLCFHDDKRVSQYKDGVWSAIKLSSSLTIDSNLGRPRWAGEVDGTLYALWATGSTSPYTWSIYYIINDLDGTVSNSDLWKKAKNLPTYSLGSAANFELCVYGSDIYLMDTTCNYLYKYSTTNQAWTKLSEFGMGSSYSSIRHIIAYNDELHIFYKRLKSSTYYYYHYKYSITDNSWTKMADPPVSSSSGCAVFDNTLHLLSDVAVGNSSTQHLFGFKNDVWTQRSKYSDCDGAKGFCSFNDEAWYLHHTGSQSDTCRLGKFCEAYRFV